MLTCYGTWVFGHLCRKDHERARTLQVGAGACFPQAAQFLSRRLEPSFKDFPNDSVKQPPRIISLIYIS